MLYLEAPVTPKLAHQGDSHYEIYIGPSTCNFLSALVSCHSVNMARGPVQGQ